MTFKYLKLLKKFDIFESKVNLYSTSRNKHTNCKSYEDDHQSICGGFFSLICFTTTAIYLFYLFKNMISGTFDNINTKFKFGEINLVNLKSDIFLPFISIEDI